MGAIAVASLVVVLTACQADDQAPGPSEPSSAVASADASQASPRTPGKPSHKAPPTSTARADEVDHVVVVSVDGLNPQVFQVLAPADVPIFTRIMAEGSFTMNARSEYEQTLTLPDHTGMLTGRRVDAARGGHGWTADLDTGDTVHEPDGQPVPSVFDVVEEAGLSSALFANKRKFAVFERSWPSIGRYVADENTDELVDLFLADMLARKRSFYFVHLAPPDHAGHDHGWLSPPYLAAVRQTDHLLGSILTGIDSSPELGRHTVLVVTADHGGTGTRHADPTDPADYTIPFMVLGPGVPGDVDLYDLNPGRADPGRSRPSYSGPQPIRNADVADLVTDLLGLGPVPTSDVGSRNPLEVIGTPRS